MVTSCNSYKEIRIEKIGGISIREMNGSTATVDLALVVNNPTNHAIYLNKVDLEIARKDAKFAQITSVGKVSIPAKSTLEKTLTLEVRLTNVLSSGFMLLSKRLKPDDFTASGYIKVSSFPFSKKIKLKNENIGTVLKGLESMTRTSQQQ